MNKFSKIYKKIKFNKICKNCDNKEKIKNLKFFTANCDKLNIYIGITDATCTYWKRNNIELKNRIYEYIEDQKLNKKLKEAKFKRLNKKEK